MAVNQRRAAVQRLARSYVERGVRLMDGGDPAAALPWLVEAWSLEQRDEYRSTTHRVRVAAAAAQAPRLVRIWNAHGPLREAEFSPNGRQILAIGGDAAFVRQNFGPNAGRWLPAQSRRGSVHVWET